VVADSKLTFTGPARFQYELDNDGKIRVNPNSTITVIWWLRDSDGVWKFWRDGAYSKIKD
jgi:hypothetical protein